jgi:hypothetical protein
VNLQEVGRDKNQIPAVARGVTKSNLEGSGRVKYAITQ